MSSLGPVGPIPPRVEPAPPLRLVRREDERPAGRERRHPTDGHDEPEDEEPEQGEDGRPHVDVRA